MARDLGTGGSRVHASAEAVIGFWLVETPAEKRFTADPALDAAIADRFGALRAAAFAHHAAGWRAAPRPLLAAIILVDQFSRNIFRDDARAYEGDPLARALTREALAKGWSAAMTMEERRFLHMPLMHSEAMADQADALRLFAQDPVSADFSRAHAAQIARFGRFPQRNPLLGRPSSVAEQAFLATPGSRF